MMGRAVLAVWFGVAPADEDELNRWYPRQHLPERLSVPGFLRGRRYAVAGEGPPYFTLYETADAGVLSSAPYLERLNAPTEWTRRVLPTFRDMVRNVYRALGAAGGASESWLVTARITPGVERAPAIRDWLAGDGVAALSRVDGVAACGLYETDTGGTSVMTEERRLVRGDVRPATPFLALSEGPDEASAAAIRTFWSGWARTMGAEVTTDVYRLLYGLAWLDPR